MIKIEAITLEAAYTLAAAQLECSVTQLKIEVVQSPSKGILGLFSKKAIIVAIKDDNKQTQQAKSEKPKNFKKEQVKKVEKTEKLEKVEKSEKTEKIQNEVKIHTPLKAKKKKSREKPQAVKKPKQEVFRDTIMPESFVSMQDDDDYGDIDSEDYEDEVVQNTPEVKDSTLDINSIVKEVDKGLNTLFSFTCFSIDKVEVSAYDATTILVEFKGEDAALLIGKEGYRYKALSYMIFNWINTKYDVQLRLEIAEFLKNQEESVSRYLEGVRNGIQRDGRAQTKILDGVLVQIALKELRASYPDKYVAIRTTRDGLKYIIVNEYNK